ncbi:MAG TPA: 2-oxoglutarate dehydrogenase, E2 component, dihydrolipoamide succinyltransferase [Anaerolineales bacterium]|nr:2-oxoglutarate dehydrogenase, E2 component, dihydrolipoamide succinyltransferase [Anaerolineales bacterium]
MPVKVLLPQLGEGVIEGTVNRWLKAEGDAVEENEPLVEVSTDKVDTEIPAPANGVVLKILAPEGAVVPVGGLLAWIGESGEAIPEEEAPKPQTAASPPEVQAGTPQAGAVPQAAPVPSAPEAPAPAPEATPPRPRVEVHYQPGRHPQLGFISPLVAKLANEHGVDLSQVRGTGLGGRITKEDVLAYLAQRQAAPAPAPAAPPAGEVAPAVVTVTPSGPAGLKARPVPTLPGDTIVPLDRIRKSIAEHMVYSKYTAPHVLTVFEADLSRVVAHRKAHKEAFAQAGVRLTFTPYFVYAAAQALQAYPIVNASWSDQGMVMHRQINIGMAVSLGEEGLIVPVIKNADELSLLGLARAVNDLAERARNRKLQPDDISGSTFSITNHGVTGSLFAFPIINQPNVAILGVGAIKKRPVVVTDDWGNDSIAIRPMVYLSLSFDHRLIDGAVADMFVAKIVEVLENWPIEG